MKRIIFLITIALTIPSFAQITISDSVVIGNGYANKAFYSLSNGTVGTMPNNNWDISVATYTVITASVRINGGFGVRLWRYSAGDTTSWNALDTTGLGTQTGWLECFDQDTAFEASAFEYGMVYPYNYGWGEYNPITHDVNGVALFVMKTHLGPYKKIWIKNQKAVGNTMTIRVANLDNSADTTVTFSKNYNTKNYIYFSLADMALMDPEPERFSYDLIFDRYLAYINPPGQYWPVTGVRLNQNTTVHEVRNTHVDDAVNEMSNIYDLTSSNMTIIGHDWKIQPPPAWTMVDSLSYIISPDLGNNVYQIWFTGFSGTSTGKYYFNKRQLAWSNIEENNHPIAKITIFPNPASDIVNLIYSTEQGINAQMLITDLNGRMIHSRILPSTSGQLSTLGFSPYEIGLKAGVYIITLSAGNSTQVQKLIIQ